MKLATSQGCYDNEANKFPPADYMQTLVPKFFLFFVFLVLISIWKMTSNERLISVDFEVFGRVQGVFFRKYTEKEAKKLGLKGWCMNTDQDTVKGVLQGSPPKVSEMKTWLEKTGSPSSRIDKAVFANQHDIAKYSYESFSVKR